MAFFSWQFILFLTCSLVIYYLVPGRFQWMVLLVSSTWYYLNGGSLRTVIYVLVTIVTTFLGAYFMDRIQSGVDARLKGKKADGTVVKPTREEKKQYKAEGQKKKRRILILVLLINFGILLVLKYGNFFSVNMNGLLAGLYSHQRLP